MRRPKAGYLFFLVQELHLAQVDLSVGDANAALKQHVQRMRSKMLLTVCLPSAAYCLFSLKHGPSRVEWAGLRGHNGMFVYCVFVRGQHGKLQDSQMLGHRATKVYVPQAR